MCCRSMQQEMCTSCWPAMAVTSLSTQLSSKSCSQLSQQLPTSMHRHASSTLHTTPLSQEHLNNSPVTPDTENASGIMIFGKCRREVCRIGELFLYESLVYVQGILHRDIKPENPAPHRDWQVALVRLWTCFGSHL